MLMNRGMTNGRQTRRATRAATYELTVVGALGPVLRHALRPQIASQAQTFTIMRAEVPGTMDLVDLVFALQANDLKLDGIFRLDD
jgi:hypothetical protein